MSPRQRETFTTWKDRLLWCMLLAWAGWITTEVVQAKVCNAGGAATLQSIDQRLQRIEKYFGLVPQGDNK